MDWLVILIALSPFAVPLGIGLFLIKYKLAYRFIDEENKRHLVTNVQDATRHFRYKIGYEPFDGDVGTLILTEQHRLGRSR